MTTRVRRWTFTLNNYLPEEAEHLKNGTINKLRYLIVGIESGELNSTPHLQGYAEFEAALTLSQAKKALGSERLHLEGSRGTSSDNRAYCSKEGNLLCERGTPAQPGRRTDLKAVTAGLKSGESIRQLIDSEKITSAPALRFAESVCKYVEPERDWKPEVIWFYGPSGCGKSRTAREWLDNTETRYVKTSGSGKWWDGYDAHPDIIWDDFRDSHCPLTDLLGLIDRYGHRLEIKGGTRQCLARRIAITSIAHPKHLYEHAKGESKEQILRRLSTIVDVQSMYRGWR